MQRVRPAILREAEAAAERGIGLIAKNLKGNKPHGRRRLSKLERNSCILGYAFLAPNIIYLLFWTLLPILVALVLSFTNYDMLQHNIMAGLNSGAEFVGLDNYKMALTNPIFQRALWQTMYFAFFSVFLTNAFGLLLAVIAHNSKGKSFFRVAYFIPNITTLTSLIIIFDALFRPGTAVTGFLSLFGISEVVWRITPGFAMPLAIIMSVWSGSGYNMLIYLAGLQEIPASVYEAASIDGTSRIKQFFHITLPLLSNKTFFLFVTGFIGSLQVYDSVQILADFGEKPQVGGPDGSLWTVVYYIYNVGWTQNKMGRAAAVSFLLFIIIMIFTFVQRKLFKDQNY